MIMKATTESDTKLRADTRTQTAPRLRASIKSQRGAGLVELSLMMPLLLLLLIGVIDMGRAFYLGIEVADAARAGAMYGYQTSATMQDTGGISTAASNDAPQVTGLTTTSSSGCMCSDGSGQSANCGNPPSCSSGKRQVNYVIVNTSATYTSSFPWPGVPSSLTLTGKAQLIAGQ
jgi:Flp pilus assembly protein TadG